MWAEEDEGAKGLRKLRWLTGLRVLTWLTGLMWMLYIFSYGENIIGIGPMALWGF